MTTRTIAGLALALPLLALLAPVGPAAAKCAENLPKVGYLGISDIECDCTTNFSIKSKNGNPVLKRIWTFRSEPTIGEVKPGGPSAGKLKDGDVITAIDGALITTREGSNRFSSLIPGRLVNFTVRRDDRELQVPVTVGEICPEELSGAFSLGELVAPRAPTPPVPPAPRTPAVAPTPEATPTPPSPQAYQWRMLAPRGERNGPVFTQDALPAGWLGVGLNCQECGGERKKGEKTPVWYFGTIPTISFVDPEGPSAKAGLRRGDQLTHIDGVPLVSEEGGRRFGSVKPGQRIQWRVIRDGKPTNVVVTAVQRPGGDDTQALGELRDQLRALRDANRELGENREVQGLLRQLRELERITPEPGPRAQTGPKRLRYAGSVGGSDIEVRGLGNVVVDDSGDEVVIVTRDATIRISPGGKARIERNKDKDGK